MAPEDRQPLRLKTDVGSLVGEYPPADGPQHPRSSGTSKSQVVDLGDDLGCEQHRNRGFQPAEVAELPKDRVRPGPALERDSLRREKSSEIGGVRLFFPNEETDGGGVRGVAGGERVAIRSRLEVPAFRALCQLEFPD